MRRIALLITVLSLAFAGLTATPTASAAPEGDGSAYAEGHSTDKAGVVPTAKQGLVPAITAIVVFGIVVFIMSAVVWPKITSGLDERANKIREEIAAAEAARAQAKSALEEYESSLSQARAEAQKMLEDTKAKQAELASELKAKADRELGEMRDRAMRDIEAARKSAVADIYNESVNLATHMASKILQREVTAGDRDRMIEESLRELEAARSN